MSDPATLAAYQLAHADHRAEVALSWDRARFFLALNAALLTAGSAIATSSRPTCAFAPLVLGILLSVVGALVVARSHDRTRRTRDTLEQAAQRAGVEGPEVTGGQRALHGKPRGERYKVTTLVIAALLGTAVVDALVAVGALAIR